MPSSVLVTVEWLDELTLLTVSVSSPKNKIHLELMKNIKECQV